MAGDDHERQADRQDPDEGGLAGDVEEYPDLEELVDREREDDQDDQQDQPDQVVEREREDLAAIDGQLLRGRLAPPLSRRRVRAPALAASSDYSITLTGTVGGLRLPQYFESSTLSFVIAAPGILRFQPHFSSVSFDSRPSTS